MTTKHQTLRGATELHPPLGAADSGSTYPLPLDDSQANTMLWQVDGDDLLDVDTSSDIITWGETNRGFAQKLYLPDSSTAAVQWLTESGSPVLQVDTTNSRIYFGPSGADWDMQFRVDGDPAFQVIDRATGRNLLLIDATNEHVDIGDSLNSPVMFRVFGPLTLEEISAPTGASGYVYVYGKSDAGTTKLYYKDGADNEVGPLGAGGGGVSNPLTADLDFDGLYDALNVAQIDLHDVKLVVNADATASNEDPYLMLQGGDGSEVVRTFLFQDSSNDETYLYQVDNGETVGTTDRGSTLIIGAGQFSATGLDADAEIILRGHQATDAVGLGTEASLLVDASADLLVVTSPGAMNLDATSYSLDGLTLTLNSDGVAGSNEDPAIYLVGGDGGSDLVRYRIEQDSSADTLAFWAEKDTGGGYGESSPSIQIGQTGTLAATLATLKFSSGNSIANKVGSIYLDSSGTLRYTAQIQHIFGQTVRFNGTEIQYAGDNGSVLTIEHDSEDHTLAAAGTSSTTMTIPQGAIVMGVVVRVTTAITGATSFDVGTSTANGAFATSVGVSLGTTHEGTEMESFIGNPASAFPIQFTANGGNFTGGKVRVVVFYRTMTAPTS